MSAGAVRKHGRLLSQLNVDGGGKSFFRDHLEGSALMLRLATGGLVSSAFLPQVRTGSGVSGAAIDYDLLATKLADSLGDRMEAAFVAGAQALPAPETNLVELRQRMKGLDKRDNKTDI